MPVAGRPATIPKRIRSLAAILGSRGATVAEFADAVGMTDRTVRNWFRNYPEFADAFKFAALRHFDERVERSLAERALGYEFDSEEIKVIDGKVVRVPVRRRFPPDVGAATLYLTNRMPHKYKRMVEVQNTGDEDRRHRDHRRGDPGEDLAVGSQVSSGIARTKTGKEEAEWQRGGR